MRSKAIGIIHLLTCGITLLWLIPVIIFPEKMAQLNDVSKVFQHLKENRTFLIYSYLAAASLTLFVVAQLDVLALHLKKRNSLFVSIATRFIPIYGIINLLVYTSQVAIIIFIIENPILSNFHYEMMFFLKVFYHVMENSLMFYFNFLAYAILAIPSLILGIEVYRYFKEKLSIGWAITGGGLLGLNGLFCITSFIGLLLQNQELIFLNFLGGGIYTIAVLIIGMGFIKLKSESNR